MACTGRDYVAALLEEHWDDLRARVRTRARRAGLSGREDEVLQETALNVLRVAHRFRTGGAVGFRRWSEAVLSNVLRRHARERWTSSAFVSLDRDAVDSANSTRLESESTGSDSLPADRTVRDIVKLRCLLGLEWEAIAGILGLGGASGARMRLRRALVAHSSASVLARVSSGSGPALRLAVEREG